MTLSVKCLLREVFVWKQYLWNGPLYEKGATSIIEHLKYLIGSLSCVTRIFFKSKPIINFWAFQLYDRARTVISVNIFYFFCIKHCKSLFFLQQVGSVDMGPSACNIRERKRYGNGRIVRQRNLSDWRTLAQQFGIRLWMCRCLRALSSFKLLLLFLTLFCAF